MTRDRSTDPSLDMLPNEPTNIFLEHRALQKRKKGERTEQYTVWERVIAFCSWEKNWGDIFFFAFSVSWFVCICSFAFIRLFICVCSLYLCLQFVCKFICVCFFLVLESNFVKSQYLAYFRFSCIWHCWSLGFTMTNSIFPLSPRLLAFRLLLFIVTVCYLSYEWSWLCLRLLLH